jgi:DNA transformation protein and related proteins
VSQTKSLTKLKNIGKKIAERLIAIGVCTESDLRRIGSVKAYRLIRAKFPNETIPVCYYLYSFEGALLGKHWDEIGEEKKQQLRAQVE